MKNIFFLFLLTTSLNSYCQTDTIPPYAKNPTIPEFKIQLADSTWFYKEDLSKKKNTLIIYFSPDCGHCKIETEDLISRLKDLQDVQIVMITSRPIDDMIPFEKHFLLNRFAQIKTGSDVKYFISRFYDVKFTPYSALYNKKGKFVKEWRKGIDWNEMMELVK